MYALGVVLRTIGFAMMGSAIVQAFQHNLPALGVILIVTAVCLVVGTAFQLSGDNY
jgi:hypothetical protein